MSLKPAPSKREIMAVIEAGSPPVPDENTANTATESELKFPMKITGDVVAAFEKARSEASLSRRSWVMLAIVEKLKRDGNL
jgi:hypothetical protein